MEPIQSLWDLSSKATDHQLVDTATQQQRALVSEKLQVSLLLTGLKPVFIRVSVVIVEFS